MSDIKRRIEARIGQLLADQPRNNDGTFAVSLVTETAQIAKDDRARFRILARGFDGPQDPTGIKYRSRCSDGISPRA